MTHYIVQIQHTNAAGDVYSNDFKVDAASQGIAENWASSVLGLFQTTLLSYTNNFKWRVSPIPSDRTSFVESFLSGPGGRAVLNARPASSATVVEVVFNTATGMPGAKFLRDFVGTDEVNWNGDVGALNTLGGAPTALANFISNLNTINITWSITIIIGKANRAVTDMEPGSVFNHKEDKRWHNRRKLIH